MLKLILIAAVFVFSSCKKDSAFLSDAPPPPAPVNNQLERGNLNQDSTLEEKFQVDPAPKDIDISFIIDNSPSMRNNIDLVKSNLQYVLEEFDFTSDNNGINVRMALFEVEELSRMLTGPDEFTSAKLQDLIAASGDTQGRQQFAANFVNYFDQLSGTVHEKPMRVAVNSLQWASAHKLNYPSITDIGSEVVDSHLFMMDCKNNTNCYTNSNINNRVGSNHYQFFSAGDNRLDSLGPLPAKRWHVVIPIGDEDAPTIGNGLDEYTQLPVTSATVFGETEVEKAQSGDDSSGVSIDGMHHLSQYLYGSKNPTTILGDTDKLERRNALKCEVYKRIKRMDNELSFLGREKGFIKFFPIINLESDIDVSIRNYNFNGGGYAKNFFIGNADSPLEKGDKVGHRAQLASEITGGQAFSLNPPQVNVDGADPACVQSCSGSSVVSCVQECMNNKHYLNIMQSISDTLLTIVQNRFRFTYTPDPETLEVYLKRPGESKELIDPSHYELKVLSNAEGSKYHEYDCRGCAGECMTSSRVIQTGQATYLVISSGVLAEDSELIVRYKKGQ